MVRAIAAFEATREERAPKTAAEKLAGLLARRKVPFEAVERAVETLVREVGKEEARALWERLAELKGYNKNQLERVATLIESGIEPASDSSREQTKVFRIFPGEVTDEQSPRVAVDWDSLREGEAQEKRQQEFLKKLPEAMHRAMKQMYERYATSAVVQDFFGGLWKATPRGRRKEVARLSAYLAKRDLETLERELLAKTGWDDIHLPWQKINEDWTFKEAFRRGYPAKAMAKIPVDLGILNEGRGILEQDLGAVIEAVSLSQGPAAEEVEETQVIGETAAVSDLEIPMEEPVMVETKPPPAPPDEEAPQEFPVIEEPGDNKDRVRWLAELSRVDAKIAVLNPVVATLTRQHDSLLGLKTSVRASAAEAGLSLDETYWTNLRLADEEKLRQLLETKRAELSSLEQKRDQLKADIERLKSQASPGDILTQDWGKAMETSEGYVPPSVEVEQSDPVTLIQRFKEVPARLRTVAGRGVESAKSRAVSLARFAKEHPEDAKRLGFEVLKQAALTASTYLGVKAFYTLPRYAIEKKRVFEVKSDLNRSLHEIMDAAWQRKHEEISGAEVAKKTRAYNQKLQTADLSPEERKAFRAKLTAALREGAKQNFELRPAQRQKIDEALDLYLKTKISGVEAARDVVNWACTLSGLKALRAVAYGGLAVAERGQKILRKNKTEGQINERFLSDLIAGRARETVVALRGQGTAWQKGMEVAKAAGILARAYGLTKIGLEAGAGGLGSEVGRIFDKLKSLELEFDPGVVSDEVPEPPPEPVAAVQLPEEMPPLEPAEEPPAAAPAQVEFSEAESKENTPFAEEAAPREWDPNAPHTYNEVLEHTLEVGSADPAGVQEGEGITAPFIRQIAAHPEKFGLAENPTSGQIVRQAISLAKKFGYMDDSGKTLWGAQPGTHYELIDANNYRAIGDVREFPMDSSMSGKLSPGQRGS